jgi:predicted  nucleic acid-binding Zn-ribbon protein
VLGLHLERLGTELRLYDQQTGRLLPTAREIAAQLRQTEEEMERLRRELEALRRRLPS